MHIQKFNNITGQTTQAQPKATKSEASFGSLHHALEKDVLAVAKKRNQMNLATKKIYQLKKALSKFTIELEKIQGVTKDGTTPHKFVSLNIVEDGSGAVIGKPLESLNLEKNPSIEEQQDAAFNMVMNLTTGGIEKTLSNGLKNR